MRNNKSRTKDSEVFKQSPTGLAAYIDNHLNKHALCVICANVFSNKKLETGTEHQVFHQFRLEFTKH